MYAKGAEVKSRGDVYAYNKKQHKVFMQGGTGGKNPASGEVFYEARFRGGGTVRTLRAIGM